MSGGFQPLNPASLGVRPTSTVIPGMSHGFEERLSALHDFRIPPFTAPVHQSPVQPGPMKGHNDPFMTVSSPNAMNGSGLGSPPNAMPPLQPTAFQQYQARPTPPATDLFGREAFQFPTPIGNTQSLGPQQSVPGSGKHYPGTHYPFSRTQEQLPNMMPQMYRPISPRPFGF